jgi:hypothetical protein
MRPRGNKVSSEDSSSALDTKVECASSPRGREVLGESGVVSSSAATRRRSAASSWGSLALAASFGKET